MPLRYKILLGAAVFELVLFLVVPVAAVLLLYAVGALMFLSGPGIGVTEWVGRGRTEFEARQDIERQQTSSMNIRLIGVGLVLLGYGLKVVHESGQKAEETRVQVQTARVETPISQAIREGVTVEEFERIVAGGALSHELAKSSPEKIFSSLLDSYQTDEMNVAYLNVLFAASDAGAMIDKKHDFLVSAAANHEPVLVSRLLALGADPGHGVTYQYKSDVTALEAAMEEGTYSPSVVRDGRLFKTAQLLLEARYGKPSASGESAIPEKVLAQAMKAEDDALVELLVEYGVDVNALVNIEYSTYYSVVGYAARRGHVDFLKKLLVKNPSAESLRSGMDQAILKDQIGAATVLLDHGVPLDEEISSLYGPYVYRAIDEGYIELAMLLIDRGASVTAPHFDKTPLQRCREKIEAFTDAELKQRYRELERRLLAAGA
jgi:hypothetical protein